MMLVPLSWLREFVPYEGPAEELGARLTMLGLELEGINHPFAQLEQIRVGFVAQCVNHPNSDHLHCCKVDLGEGELLDIVCGAPNVAEGQKVAVAPVGAVLPDGTVIKKAKLRGQPSFGMICSERELGLSDDHSGIMVLPESSDIGKSLLDALDLERDVLDLSITPNRADCLSIIGIARETALAWGLPFHVPELPLIPDPLLDIPEVPLDIKNPGLCWLYSGRVLAGARIEKSPMRMRYRLLSVGIRPISNIVDITNYVLFETGQPLHAFDLEKLAGPKISVACAGQNTRFVTLDGKERLLEPADLCICDAEKPVALAGVMGGLDSEITDTTTRVFLESAVFAPTSIRKTARRLGLTSEASFRFERGVDQRKAIWAQDRACALMASIAGAKVSQALSVAEPKPFVPVKINYRPQRCNSILGCQIPAEIQSTNLENDGCAVEKYSEDAWLAVQPSWRHDLTREADLIEEVSRIYGVDKIPLTLPAIIKSLEDEKQGGNTYRFLSRIRHWAAGIGLHEAINYTFTAKNEVERLEPGAADILTILNPLSEEQNALRTNLAPGLLWDLENNIAHGAQSVRLFEIAAAFHADPQSETGAAETGLLGILLYGNTRKERLGVRDQFFSYADLKGIMENLFKFLHLPDLKAVLAESHPFLHPCVKIFCSGIQAGYMGRVRPDLANAYNAQKPVWLAEAKLDCLRELHERSKVVFRSLPVFPPVRRDMTVITDNDYTVDGILEKIFSQKLPLLEGAELVDIFTPENSRERNLTFRLTFRHPAKTLKDQEVDREREKIAEFLRKNLAVRI